MPPESNAEDKGHGADRTAAPLRIAIFDDSREAIDNYRQHFAVAHVELLAFTGSRLYPGVLRQLAEFRPQLIISDLLIGSSREDGYALLEELHESDEVGDVPVVVCSKLINNSTLGKREAQRCAALPCVEAAFPKFPALRPVGAFLKFAVK